MNKLEQWLPQTQCISILECYFISEGASETYRSRRAQRKHYDNHNHLLWYWA